MEEGALRQCPRGTKASQFRGRGKGGADGLRELLEEATESVAQESAPVEFPLVHSPARQRASEISLAWVKSRR